MPKRLCRERNVGVAATCQHTEGHGGWHYAYMTTHTGETVVLQWVTQFSKAHRTPAPVPPSPRTAE